MQWTEIYRPKKLDAIIQHKHIIELLKAMIKTGNMPHLIFHGPSGTGKTTTILALARELFRDKFRDRILELNASDERGINIVRNKIIKYAKNSIDKDPNYPLFKLIILDEADTMTNYAQAALRKIMEEYSGITRFCFICNYIDEIIEPIISRCTKFKFQIISNDKIKKYLQFIIKKENFKIEEKILDKIIKFSDGDIRKAIINLQNLHYFKNNKINKNIVYKLNNYVTPYQFNIIWNTLINENIDNVIMLVNKIYISNINSVSIIKKIQKRILKSKFNDEIKSLICVKSGLVLHNINNGASENIQLLNFLTYINGLINNIIKNPLDFIN